MEHKIHTLCRFIETQVPTATWPWNTVVSTPDLCQEAKFCSLSRRDRRIHLPLKSCCRHTRILSKKEKGNFLGIRNTRVIPNCFCFVGVFVISRFFCHMAFSQEIYSIYTCPFSFSTAGRTNCCDLRRVLNFQETFPNHSQGHPKSRSVFVWRFFVSNVIGRERWIESGSVRSSSQHLMCDDTGMSPRAYPELSSWRTADSVINSFTFMRANSCSKQFKWSNNGQLENRHRWVTLNPDKHS